MGLAIFSHMAHVSSFLADKPAVKNLQTIGWVFYLEKLDRFRYKRTDGVSNLTLSSSRNVHNVSCSAAGGCGLKKKRSRKEKILSFGSGMSQLVFWKQIYRVHLGASPHDQSVQQPWSL